MDIRQLRYFVNVVEAGSFTAASRILGIAQPSLSQHVIGLERELGVQLLERQARGVRLTASGATFLEHAITVLRDLDRRTECCLPQNSNARPPGLPGQYNLSTSLGVSASAAVVIELVSADSLCKTNTRKARIPAYSSFSGELGEMQEWLAGREGFRTSAWWNQNPLPYHLAMPRQTVWKAAALAFPRISSGPAGL